MKAREITIIKDGVRQSATVEYEGGKPTLTVSLQGGVKLSYTAEDLYVCFGLLRNELKEIQFLCKGAKINVHTSGMSSHMSNGLIAYELTMGQPDGESVHIFSYEENDLTNDIQEQHDYCARWATSLLQRKPE